MTESGRDQASGSEETPDANNPGSKAVGSEKRTTAEWTTLAISVLVVLAFLGAITWLQISSNSGTPPIIAVEAHMQDLRHDETGYYLPVSATNEGEETV